jgi:hypothetical protein
MKENRVGRAALLEGRAVVRSRALILAHVSFEETP